MSPPDPDQADDTPAVTHLLSRIRAGDRSAHERLLPLVYTELNQLARAVFAGQKAGHTLQPTALVHEAWLKLAGGLEDLESRTHFFAVAGRAMRQVVADHARAKRTEKRGGGARRVTLDTTGAEAAAESEVDLVALDEVLQGLAECEPRHAQVVELRLFGGLTVTETAAALGVTERTVYTDWAMAKAWLRTRLAGSE